MTQTSPLSIKGTARLKSINLRVEGNEDNRTPAADLKVEVNTTADVLLSFHPTLRLMLFDKDGAPRYPAIPEIKWDAEIPSALITLKRPGRKEPFEYVCKKLKSFEFVPFPGFNLGMTMSAQIYPADGDADHLHRMLQEDVEFTAHRVGDLVDDMMSREAADAAKKLHEMGKKDGGSITISTGDGQHSVTLGAMTDEIRAAVERAGRLSSTVENGDFERSFAEAVQEYGTVFVEEHMTELRAWFTDGWQAGPAEGDAD